MAIQAVGFCRKFAKFNRLQKACNPLYYTASWLDNRWFIEALNRVRTT